MKEKKASDYISKISSAMVVTILVLLQIKKLFRYHAIIQSLLHNEDTYRNGNFYDLIFRWDLYPVVMILLYLSLLAVLISQLINWGSAHNRSLAGMISSLASAFLFVFGITVGKSEFDFNTYLSSDDNAFFAMYVEDTFVGFTAMTYVLIALFLVLLILQFIRLRKNISNQ